MHYSSNMFASFSAILFESNVNYSSKLLALLHIHDSKVYTIIYTSSWFLKAHAKGILNNTDTFFFII